jgi:hypothetical protein
MERTWKDFKPLIVTNKMKWEALEVNSNAATRRNPVGNISTWDDPLVSKFGGFLSIYAKGGVWLDVGSKDFPPYQELTTNRVHYVSLNPERGDYTIEDIHKSPTKYNGLICATSIAHFYDFRKAIRNMRFILMPLGILVLWESWPGYRNLLKHKIKLMLNRRYQFIQGHWYYVPPGCVNAFHRRLYSPDYLVRAFKSEGFHLIGEEEHGTSYFQAYRVDGY